METWEENFKNAISVSNDGMCYFKTAVKEYIKQPDNCKNCGGNKFSNDHCEYCGTKVYDKPIERIRISHGRTLEF